MLADETVRLGSVSVPGVNAYWSAKCSEWKEFVMVDTSDMWYSAVEALPKESELETVDQRIAFASVLAQLSIAQELNGFVLGESPLGARLMGAFEKPGAGGA